MKDYIVEYSSGDGWKFDSSHQVYEDAIIRSGQLLKEVKNRFSPDYFRSQEGGVRIIKSYIKDQWKLK